MSSKYQKPYTIPEGFPELLKSFTREILRAQPDNIYEFGAQYFSEVLANQGAPQYQGVADVGPEGVETLSDVAAVLDIQNLSPAELEPIIMQLFLAADTDQSGFLDRSEFTQVLKSANLNLSNKVIRQILAEADENEDNVIEYKEFLPVMIDILQGLKATGQAQDMMGRADELVRGAVEDMLVHGMSKQELEALMRKVFIKADADQSGSLDRKEFRDALKAAKLGLTRRDINLIMSSADTDQDGLISYEEFIPVCFQVLVERFKDEIVTNDILSNQDGLQGMLLQAFQAADQEGTGTLSQTKVKKILEDLSYESLGLSTLQLVTLMSQAPTTQDGAVHYVQFVPIASNIIYQMYDVDSIKLRIQAVKQVADAGGVQMMTGMDFESLRALLQQLFEEADVNGTGQLTLPEVMQVLEQLGSDETIQLSDLHMKAMFNAIDVDDNGLVDWYELVSFICDAIEHVEREHYISQMAGQMQR
ncbi:hypothetical protein CEUSTIGMA_g9275.t1 [Chlamydomonas eustigma]|uniref:EF-hand domain-containing protein n=1 Tax=Chlamydomonas eustigma TaxID=1157962 RepID=A0A250XFK2_9CHLO|nr:hypothetical protein CEUSTIGMA_g9275.t1 [Chlamydomonas eustigma]|eukprot:GAX81847.1 hypothetical protein CEUSTIGMA_g9275.t1 [Chlamydomonas eustigma]